MPGSPRRMRGWPRAEDALHAAYADREAARPPRYSARQAHQRASALVERLQRCAGKLIDRLSQMPLMSGYGTKHDSYRCSNRVMVVHRPEWWCYPERCANGHEWGPGLITVSWSLCDCGPAVAASAGGAPGHLAVYCSASPGCRSVWYRPQCERRG